MRKFCLGGCDSQQQKLLCLKGSCSEQTCGGCAQVSGQPGAVPADLCSITELSWRGNSWKKWGVYQVEVEVLLSLHPEHIREQELGLSWTRYSFPGRCQQPGAGAAIPGKPARLVPMQGWQRRGCSTAWGQHGRTALGTACAQHGALPWDRTTSVPIPAGAHPRDGSTPHTHLLGTTSLPGPPQTTRDRYSGRSPHPCQDTSPGDTHKVRTPHTATGTPRPGTLPRAPRSPPSCPGRAVRAAGALRVALPGRAGGGAGCRRSGAARSR